MADIILVLVVVLFMFFGYKRGFSKTLLSVLSSIISVVFSVIFSNPVANLVLKSPLGEMISDFAETVIKRNLGASELVESSASIMAEGVATVVSSVISFILIALIIKIAVMLIAQAVGIVKKLPIIKQVNAALGAIVGIFSGLVISYVLVGIIFALNVGEVIESGLMIESIENSIVCSQMYYNNIVGNTLASIV